MTPANGRSDLRIDPGRQEAYIRSRRLGASKAEAAREARISRQTAYRIEERLPEGWLAQRHEGNGRSHTPAIAEEDVPEPIPPHQLTTTAQAALEDFSLFRRRYLGRVSSPWQEDAAERMVRYLSSPVREYVVVNAPPGPGKSTLFTHDLVTWLIVRNRRIRVMIGSVNFNLSAKYTGRVRRTLSRRTLATPPDDHIARGLAHLPEAILVADYGRFAPLQREEVWTRGGFVVAQFDEETIGDKEMTVEAFGFDTEFLGGRFDLVVWDDLVTPRNMRRQETREKLFSDYEDAAETRLEPGGLLILQGQRISSHDLYRHALDQRIPVWWDDPDRDLLLAHHIDRPDAEPGEGEATSPPDPAPNPNPWLSDELVTLDRDTTVTLGDGRPRHLPGTEDIAGYRAKYHHVVYPAHNEARCVGLHRLSDPAWSPHPAPGEGGGCLLDPKRLPWSELLGHMAQNPLKYRVLYQQEDTDEANVLVRRIWVDGGRDPDTGESFPGCTDLDRMACPPLRDLPHTARELWAPLTPPQVKSVVTMDPSPSRYWAIQWWLWDPDTTEHWLLDSLRQPLTASAILDWDVNTTTFTGILEEWYQRSIVAGYRITHLIPEVNVAQKWLLQYDHFRRWSSTRSVIAIPHTTGINKADMDRGVESTQGHWIHGRIRLPYHPTRGKPVSDLLVNEALHWPEGMTDDQVMAHWFLALRAPLAFPRRPQNPTLLRRPSWLRPVPPPNPFARRSA